MRIKIPKLPLFSGAGRTGIKKSTKIFNILVVSSLLLSYFTPILPFLTEARADDFYVTGGDNGACRFASTVAVGYDNLGGGGINYDPAQVSGYSRAWIDNARFLDVASPWSPDPHRYWGVADGVAVPPNTRVSLAFYAWNYTDHGVNVNNVETFLSRQNQGGGVSNLGGGGTYASSSWRVGQTTYTRTGMRVSSGNVGWYNDRGNEDGRIVHEFTTIQPIIRQSFTATPVWSGANLSIRYDLTLRNSSNYNLCNIRVRDTMPSGQTYDQTHCINAGQTRTISYTENWGTSYPMSITNNNVRVDDNNTHREVTAERMVNAYDNRPEVKTAIAYRNDSTNPNWYASQTSWGMQNGELFSVTLIPYWFEGGSASVNLTEDVSLSKRVSDSDETLVVHNTASNQEEITYRVSVTNDEARVTNMRIIDDYDQNYITILDADGGTDNGDRITWTATMEHGETRTWNVRARINELEQGNYTFHNRVWTENPDSPDEEVITDVNPEAVINLTKTVTDSDETNVKVNTVQGDHYLEGERRLTFNINYQNTGDAYARNVILTDDLTQFVDDGVFNRVENISGGGTFNSSNNIITWNIGDLQYGQSGSQSFDLVLNRISNNDRTVTNTTTIDSDQTPPVTDTTNTNIITPELVIEKTDGVDTASTGETLYYVITIRNTGTGDAYDLIIKDILPDYVENVSNISDSGVYDGGTRTIIWQSSTQGEYSLLSGASREFTFEVTIPDIMPVGTTTLTNRATVENPNIPPTEDDDTTDVTALPELDLEKYVINLTAMEQGRSNSGEGIDGEFGADADSWYADNRDVISIAGDRIQYTLVYRNTGDAHSPDTFVADHLPRYIIDENGNQYEIIRIEDFESIDDDLTPVENGNGWDIVWDIGEFEVSQDWTTKQFIVRLNPSEEMTFSYEDTERLIDNLSEIFSENPLVESNDEDNAIIRVDQPVAEITKGADKVIYQSNEEVIYTIEVVNNGSHRATGVVRDTIPTGMHFISSSPDTSRINGSTIEWDLTLEAGGTATIIVNAGFDIPVSDGQFFDNRATYDYTDDNENERPDVIDDEEIQVIAPELQLEKIAYEPDPITPTNVISYELKLTNNGDGNAFNVVLKDDVPVELDVLTDSISNGGQYDSNTRIITWSIGTLGSGQTVSRTFKARIKFENGIDNGDIITNRSEAGSDTSEDVEDEVDSEISCGYLQGIVWEDSNKDAVIDQNELRIPNAEIKVTVEDFEKYGARFVSDENGHYVATCLPFERKLYVDIIRPNGYVGQTTVNHYVVKLSKSGNSTIYQLSESGEKLFVWAGNNFDHADLGLFRSYNQGSVLGISTVAKTGGIFIAKNILPPVGITFLAILLLKKLRRKEDALGNN